MKDAFGFAALVAAFVAAWFVTPASAGTAWIYDGNGNLAGTVQSAGPNNNFVYDGNGNLAGSTARAGNSTYFYGADGGYRGSATGTGDWRFR